MLVKNFNGFNSNIFLIFVTAAKMQVRVKLYILSFIGFMVNYMLRTDMNIALLAMARQNFPNNTNIPNLLPPVVRNTSIFNFTMTNKSSITTRSLQSHLDTSHSIPQVLMSFYFFIKKK